MFCICDSLWCDSLGNWTDIHLLKWVGSSQVGPCSSCRFREILQDNPAHEKYIRNLALNHSSLSPSCAASRSFFLSFSLSNRLACSHVLTLWVMATAHDVLTFYHHFNRAGRGTAKVVDSVSIHPPQRQNQSSLDLLTVSALACTGYPLIQAHSHIYFHLYLTLTLLAFYSFKETKKHGMLHSNLSNQIWSNQMH